MAPTQPFSGEWSANYPVLPRRLFFQGKPVLATWVALGPSFSCPLVDSGGPLAGKADAMLPTDGLSAPPVSPRLLLMSQGKDFFLLHVWFVTLSISTL